MANNTSDMGYCWKCQSVLGSSEKIESIHALYWKLTSQFLKLDMNREHTWQMFLKRFTEDDLRLVIAHLKKGIDDGERRIGCLRFSNLIEQTDRFEEELAMARAYYRNNKPQTNRAKAIKVFRPEVNEPRPESNYKAISGIMPKLIEEMRKAIK